MRATPLNHNSLRDAIAELLRPYVRPHKLGRVVTDQEYDFDGNAHGPDVSFFRPQKEKLVDGRRSGTAEMYVFSLKTKQIFRYSEHHTVVLNERDEFRSAQTPPSRSASRACSGRSDQNWQVKQPAAPTGGKTPKALRVYSVLLGLYPGRVWTRNFLPGSLTISTKILRNPSFGFGAG